MDVASLALARFLQLHTVGAEDVLPPILFIFLPPASAFSSEAASGIQTIDLLTVPQAKALRGTLALLLRSISSPDEATNYCALHANPRHR